MICIDFFAVRGMEFLVIDDRYSNYPVVYRALSLSPSGVGSMLWSIVRSFGVPERLTTDGGTAFTSHEMGEFLKDWGVDHHQTATYIPHSNLQAEVVVRSVTRFFEECMGPGGSLDIDRFAKATITYQNTPCRYLGLSLGQIKFFRYLRNQVPVDPSKLKLRPEWVLTAEQREVALARCHVAGENFWSHAKRDHGELVVGQDVHIQDQTEVHKGKLRTTRGVLEVCGH